MFAFTKCNKMKGAHTISILQQVLFRRPLNVSARHESISYFKSRDNLLDFDLQGLLRSNNRGCLDQHVCGFTTSQFNNSEKQRSTNELDIKRRSAYEGLTKGEKVKEATKDASYIGIIVAGLALIGGVVVLLGRELLSSDSVNGVYSKSLKLCKKNEEVKNCIGEPMKGYGETTQRGRRRHCSHFEFVTGGVQHMRVQFYIEGPIRKGTVHVEVFKDESGHYKYKYLIVELDGYPKRQILVEGSV